jgi:hypothetical protein
MLEDACSFALPEDVRVLRLPKTIRQRKEENIPLDG